jgi:hypothetical protein
MKSFDATVSHGVLAVVPAKMTTRGNPPVVRPVDISWLREAPAVPDAGRES